MGERRFQLPDGDIAFAPYLSAPLSLPRCALFSACLVSHYSLFTLHFTLAINWSSFVQDDPAKVAFIGRYDAIYWLVFLGLVVSQGVVGFEGREGGGD